MGISFYKSVTESLGFSVHHYDTAFRLAWLPLLLSVLASMVAPYLLLSLATGEVITIEDYPLDTIGQALMGAGIGQGTLVVANICLALFVTIMYTAFFVPLIRYAGRGVVPGHHSASIHFGGRHLKFLVSTVATIGVIGMVLYAPLLLSVYFIRSYVSQAMQRQVAVFPDEDSLHRVDVQAGLENPWVWSVFNWIIVCVFVVAILYFSLRLFVVPFFAAVREKSDTYNSVRASWRLTRSWNAAKLALAILVLWLFTVIVSIIMNVYVAGLLQSAMMAMYAFADQTASMAETLGGDHQPVLDFLTWTWAVTSILANMAYLIFFYGLIAGLGGSLVRQSGVLAD